MATSMENDIEIDDLDDTIISSSQPNLSTLTTLETPYRPNKRPSPLSPDNLPATAKQNTRQTRRRNSIGDPRDLSISKLKKPPVPRKTISDKIIEAFTSKDVLDQIIPVISNKIGESISKAINEAIETHTKTYIDEHIIPMKQTIDEQNKKIDEQKKIITKQANMIVEISKDNTRRDNALKEQDIEIDHLHNKMNNLEIRLENQEQYSRRTSLRFHNISVPVDERGNILHPVDTDSLIVDICNNKLNVNITKEDIGRSHVIGSVRNGKSQVIVRFLSYRNREKVYNAKKILKGDPDKLFITENLTKFRTDMVKALADLKFNGHINSYWTSDGRIYAKQNQEGRKVMIRCHDDISNMLRNTQIA